MVRIGIGKARVALEGHVDVHEGFRLDRHALGEVRVADLAHHDLMLSGRHLHFACVAESPGVSAVDPHTRGLRDLRSGRELDLAFHTLLGPQHIPRNQSRTETQGDQAQNSQYQSHVTLPPELRPVSANSCTSGGFGQAFLWTAGRVP